MVKKRITLTKKEQKQLLKNIELIRKIAREKPAEFIKYVKRLRKVEKIAFLTLVVVTDPYILKCSK